MYDFRRGSFVISWSLIVKFKLVSEASSGRELVCSSGLIQTYSQITQVNETGRQKWGKKSSKENGLNKPSPRFILLHTACFRYPTCSASSNVLWIYSEHTDQAAWRISTPNSIREGNPNTSVWNSSSEYFEEIRETSLSPLIFNAGLDVSATSTTPSQGCQTSAYFLSNLTL